MKKSIRLFLSITLLIFLTACTNYEDIYNAGLDSFRENQFSVLNENLIELETGDEVLYGKLLEEFEQFVSKEVDRYLLQDDYDSAIEYITKVRREVVSFPNSSFDSLTNRIQLVQELELAKDVYLELNNTFIIADIFASDTYSAWRYGIREKNHSKTGLASKVSLRSYELVGSACNLLRLDDFNYTVNCVKQSHSELGNYSIAKQSLDNVRVSINTLRGSKNNDIVNLARDLQGYYASLVNLSNLAESYSGSFNALTNDIRDLRAQVNDHKSKLDFDLG